MNEPRSLGKRGLVLIEVLVLTALLCAWLGALLQMSLNMAMAERLQEGGRQAELLSEAAATRALNCLSSVNASSCAALTGTACGPCGFPCSQVFGTYAMAYPGGGEARTISVSVSDPAPPAPAGPPCRISVRCLDCR